MRQRCSVRCLIFLVAAVAMMPSAGARAASAEGPPETTVEIGTRAAACEMLRQGRYADLDATMNGLQQDYEAGRLADFSLMHNFRLFCPDHHKLDDRFDAWVAAFPKSYAARLADSVYLSDMADYWRGGDAYDTLSQTQIETMTDYAKRGLAQLRLSLPLTAKPLLSFYVMIGLATITKDPAASREALDAADKIDPKNFVVRYKYLTTPLTTRLGGSLDKMIAFRAETQQAGMPPEQLAYFDAQIDREKDWLEYCACSH